MATVGTTFNVFSYDAVWAKHLTHHIPNAKQIRYVLCHGRGLKKLVKNIVVICDYGVGGWFTYEIRELPPIRNLEHNNKCKLITL